MTEKDIAEELMKEAREVDRLEQIKDRALMSDDPPTISDIEACSELLLILGDELQELVDEIESVKLDQYELLMRMIHND